MIDGNACICGARPHHKTCYQEYNAWHLAQGLAIPPATSANIKKYLATMKSNLDADHIPDIRKMV